MRHRHDHAVRRLGIDAQRLRQRSAINNQGVVARGLHWGRTPREESLPIMPHLGHFPVHRQLAAHDSRAERLADRLMAETDAEEWSAFVEADEIDDAARPRRRSRPRRDHDRSRPFLQQRVRVERVIPNHTNIHAGKPLDLLNQVVGEGVVVIDDDDRAKDGSGRRDGWGSWHP